MGSLSQRYDGVGIVNLNYQVQEVLNGQLWRLVTYPFVQSSPFELILSLIVLWLFGSWFEGRWGKRDFLKFFMLAAMGSGLLALPLSYLINVTLPFRDLGQAEGPGAAFDAMLVALAMTAPDSKVLFGFVLPIRAKTIIFLLLGFQLILGIQTGAAGLSITLGGMAMGYLLVTGNWRPQRWNFWKKPRKKLVHQKN